MSSRSRLSGSLNRAAREHSQRVLTQQSLMIPHKQNGEVDWNTLGNILTAAITGEVLCAGYIDRKHRMARPNFTVETEWKYAYEEDGVVVLRKEFPDSPFHCWMGRTIVERPLREIASFLECPESAKIYDKYIKESKHLEILSQSDTHKDAIAYYFTETRECLVTAKRDFLFYLRHAYTDGKYVLTALSVDHPQCPLVDDVPRAQIQAGSGWHLEPHMGSNHRTLVSYLAHVDLIGLPPIIANRALKRQPLNILYLKRHLMARQQQRRQHSASLPPSLPDADEVFVHPYQSSGRHFEEPLPIRAFTNEQTESIKRKAADSGTKQRSHSSDPPRRKEADHHHS